MFLCHSILAGYETMEELDILPRRSGYSNSYDSTIDPRIVSAFAGAAFRFGHSLVYKDLPAHPEHKLTFFENLT